MTEEVAVVGDEGAFRRRTVAILIGVAGVSLLVAIGLMIFSDDMAETSTADANAFSRSAIGHGALVELLRELDIPVVVSQSSSGSKAQGDNTLIVAEPIVYDADGARGHALRALLDEASTALVVLPKWWGTEDVLRPDWLDQVGLLDAGEVGVVLDAMRVAGTVERPGAVTGVVSAQLGPAPDLLEPQVIVSDELEAIVWSDQGVLIGRTWVMGTQVWIVSDPDLLNNHGLRRGDNAVLAIALIEELRRGSGAVVLDETMHGFTAEDSLWAALFEFPLALASLQILLTVGVLLWAATGRFGAPLPPAPVIEPGKAFLIDNTAALMRFGRHDGHALRRYMQTSVQDVAAALHAPHDLGPANLRAWLQRLADARGVRLSLAALEREVEESAARKADSARHVVTTAHRIYRWRQEMIHGPAGHPPRQ